MQRNKDLYTWNMISQLYVNSQCQILFPLRATREGEGEISSAPIVQCLTEHFYCSSCLRITPLCF